MMNKNLRVIIRKGQMTIVDTARSALLNAQPTYDGMVFAFRENFTLTYTDQYMTNATKELIANTTNSFLSASIEIDLANYAKPVLASVSKS